MRGSVNTAEKYKAAVNLGSSHTAFKEILSLSECPFQTFPVTTVSQVTEAQNRGLGFETNLSLIFHIYISF